MNYRMLIKKKKHDINSTAIVINKVTAIFMRRKLTAIF